MKHIERHLKSVINISATFIGAKYGNEWGGWCTKSVSGAYGVRLWKCIRSGWLNFSKCLRYNVGDGTRVKF